MSNEISILLTVDGVDVLSRKFKTARDEVKATGRVIEQEAAKRVAESQKIAAAVEREARSYGGSGRAAQSAAVFIKAEIEQREQSLLTIRNAVAARVAEATATEETARRMRAAMAAQSAEENRQAANRAALQAFKIKTIGETVDAEIAAQAKINRLHAAALAEDIAREKARTAAIVREREKAATARTASLRNFGTGVASYAGLGAGANALGAGLAVAGGVYFSSKTAIDFERAEKAIEATTGSLTAARAQIALTEKDAERLGVNITNLAQQWAKFEAASRGTKLEGAQTRDIFLAVTEAAQKLNLGAEQTQGVMVALTQMMSKGKIQAEELRGQLGDRLPGAFNIMARAAGLTTAELDKLMKQGGVATDEVLPAFAQELRRTVNTDVNTRIETTVSNFTRLINEIKLTAAAIGDKLNPALSKSSGHMADILRYSREHPYQAAGLAMLAAVPGAAPIAGSAAGALARRDREREQAQSLRDAQVGRAFVFDPTGSRFDAGNVINPASGPLIRPQAATPTGIDLLTAGTGDADEKAVAKLKQKLALLNEESHVRQVIYRITQGDLQNADNARKNAELNLARAEDEKKAREDAERAATRQDKLDDKAAARAVDQIRAQLAYNAGLQQEIDTGQDLTRSQRDLLELKFKTADVAGKSLETEIKTGIALEAQRHQQEEGLKAARRTLDERDRSLQAKADQLRRELDPSRISGRTLRDANGFAGIDAATNDRFRGERDRFSDQMADLRESRERLLREGENYDALVERAQREHEQKLTQIKREGDEARRRVQEMYIGASVEALDNLSTVAEAFGRKGFEAYKAVEIAKATISTFTSAQNSYESLSAIPVVGPALGAVAAGTAVAAGLVRIAQIRAQTFGGGRETGGVVSPDKFYEIHEMGRPELVESNGRFWLADAQGQVHSAQKASATAGAAPQFQIINNAPGVIVTPRGNTVTVEMLPELRRMIVGEARQAVAADAGDLRSPLSRNLAGVHRTAPRAVR